MIGARLSHYRIVSEIGRGGMGVVYLARDDRLERTVALKVLPVSALVHSEDRSRFYREARTAASLAHPHIATVHEIDEAAPEGVPGGEPRPFIAMEYVEGESLAARIAQGPLPLGEAVRIAREIASGLDAAHAKGIVHRDIKSANVMLGTGGCAKILDFGLAQVAASTRLTRMGSTLGTVAYMSPEQARGEPVDRRTDLWSLGVVLYEMLAGRLPFPGEFEQAIIYAILNEDPEPLTAIRSGIPMELERIVTKLLRKERDVRYQHADEVVADLVDPGSTGGSRRTAASSQQRSIPSPPARLARYAPLMRRGAGLIGAFVLGMLLVWMLHRPGSSDPSGPLFLNFRATAFDQVYSPRISPDGRRLVFGGIDSTGDRLYVKDLSSAAPERPIKGTEGAWFPFLSPDGSWVGYVVNAALSIVLVDGGPAVPVATNVSDQGHWADDGFIYIKDTINNLIRLTPDGSRRDTLAVTDRRAGEETRIHPFKIPETDWLLFTISDWRHNRIAALNIASGELRSVVDNGAEPRVLPTGHLVFTRATEEGQTQMVTRIHLQTLELLAPPVPLPGLSVLFFSSRQGNGTFVGYPDEDPWLQLTLLGMDGSEQRIRSSRTAAWPRISPTGEILAVRIGPGTEHWAYNLALTDSKVAVLSQGPLFDSGAPSTYCWSPDGSAVAFGNLDGGFVVKRLDRMESEFHAQGTGVPIYPTSWSSNGAVSLYAMNPRSRRDLWVYRFSDSTATPFHQTLANERGGAISPDGRWLAYTSDESGQDEIWVQPFPTGGQKYRVTNEGGFDAGWSVDGRFLFYGKNGQLRAIPVDISSTFRVTGPVRIVAEPVSVQGNMRNYDMHPDGKHLVVFKFVGEEYSNVIQVVTNGFSLVNEAAPR